MGTCNSLKYKNIGPVKVFTSIGDKIYFPSYINIPNIMNDLIFSTAFHRSSKLEDELFFKRRRSMHVKTNILSGLDFNSIVLKLELLVF